MIISKILFWRTKLESPGSPVLYSFNWARWREFHKNPPHPKGDLAQDRCLRLNHDKNVRDDHTHMAFMVVWGTNVSVWVLGWVYLYILSIYLLIFIYCMFMCIPQPVSQRTAWRSWFSPAMWIPAVNLRSSDLAASAFTSWSVSPAPIFIDFFFDRVLHITDWPVNSLCNWGWSWICVSRLYIPSAGIIGLSLRLVYPKQAAVCVC